MEDPDRKEESGRTKLRTMLGELLEHMEDAQEVAGGIAREHPQYGAMAEAVRSAAELASMACEAEAYGEREGDD